MLNIIVYIINITILLFY